MGAHSCLVLQYLVLMLTIVLLPAAVSLSMSQRCASLPRVYVPLR